MAKKCDRKKREKINFSVSAFVKVWHKTIMIMIIMQRKWCKNFQVVTSNYKLDAESYYKFGKPQKTNKLWRPPRNREDSNYVRKKKYTEWMHSQSEWKKMYKLYRINQHSKCSLWLNLKRETSARIWGSNWLISCTK